MRVLIVTGGIGSGKSTVCSMLSNDYGYPVYEADRRVKDLYLEHPSLLADIEEALGECFRNDDGVFQPARLANRSPEGGRSGVSDIDGRFLQVEGSEL